MMVAYNLDIKCHNFNLCRLLTILETKLFILFKDQNISTCISSLYFYTFTMLLSVVDVSQYKKLLSESSYVWRL